MLDVKHDAQLNQLGDFFDRESSGAVCPVQRLNQDLKTQDPQRYQRVLFDLAQVVTYASASKRNRLIEIACLSTARTDTTRSLAWVEGVFFVGGERAFASLAEHARGQQGCVESRELASAYSAELERAHEQKQFLLQHVHPTTKQRNALLRLPLHSSFTDAAADVNALTLTPTQLRQQLRELNVPKVRQLMLDAAIAPVLATDCDGTTWKHDIGETLFTLAVEQGIFLPVAHPPLKALLQRFGLVTTDDVNNDAATLKQAFDSGALQQLGAARSLTEQQVTALYYGANLWCFAGHRVATMKAWGRALFESAHGFKGKLFAGVRELLTTAREQQLIPYAISASNQWIVEIGAEYLGIPPWRVAGVKTVAKDGCIGSEIVEPLPYGEGKLRAIIALAGAAPAVAMGDSVDATDRELLDAALVKIAVEPSPSRHGYVLARGRDNWRVLDYTETVDGEAADAYVSFSGLRG